MAAKIHSLLKTSEFTLDDVILPPIRIPGFNPAEVDTTVQLTKRITLKRPVIGSPMDTVTASRMAVLLAEIGGIAVIHNAFSVEDQLQEIEVVRRARAGFVLNPQVLGPQALVLDVINGERELGYSSYPITEDGTLNSPIIGIVTKRDVQDLEEAEHNLLVSKVMTPKERLVTADRKKTLDINDIRAANKILKEKGLDTLPIVDRKGLVVALVTRSDIQKDSKYPHATRDKNRQLKVLAAVESRPELAIPRLEAIANSGICGIVIDSRNIYQGYKEIAKYAKKKNPNLDVIIGNIVHPAVLKQILEESDGLVDAFRVGIGTGEVCITSEDLGVGRAMGSALVDLDNAFKQLNRKDKYGYIGFIADGGIKFPKHFLVGASLIKNFAGIMMGSAIAGYDQSPSQKIQLKPGVTVKSVRGMGSTGAIAARAGSSRYGVAQIDPSKRYAEGIEKHVPAIGDGEIHLERFFTGVQTAMHSLGAKNVSELYQIAELYPVAKAGSKGTL